VEAPAPVVEEELVAGTVTLRVLVARIAVVAVAGAVGIR
jgi:hypothetical protein